MNYNRKARAEALAAGERLYYTGLPCKHGHTGPRRTDCAHCVECMSIRSTRSARKHVVRKRATDRARYAADPGKDLARQAKRRARKLNQACTCCTSKDFLIVYKCAAIFDSEVDHRIPLHLGGLHCCKNLQILTKAEHTEKTAAENRARFRLVA